MMDNRNIFQIKRGISILEVLISMIILALVMEGFTALLISTKRHMKRSGSKMVEAELGRYFIDPLQSGVRLDQWGSNCVSSLGIDTNCAAETATQTIGPVTYTPRFEKSVVLDQLGSPSTLRKVKLTVSYPQQVYE